MQSEFYIQIMLCTSKILNKKSQNLYKKFKKNTYQYIIYFKLIYYINILSILSFFTISVANRYRNLYRPILITIPIRHFPYRQNRYIGRYRNCIGRTLSRSDLDYIRSSNTLEFICLLPPNIVLLGVHKIFRYLANGRKSHSFTTKIHKI